MPSVQAGRKVALFEIKIQLDSHIANLKSARFPCSVYIRKRFAGEDGGENFSQGK
jgi:hypothetical protein